MQAQGLPWVLRKASAKYGAAGSTDIVVHSGGELNVVTLNSKGVWSRRTVVGRELSQPNAAGVTCKATASWEGAPDLLQGGSQQHCCVPQPGASRCEPD